MLKKISIIMVTFVILITMSGCSKKETDGLKFKEEYESLNDVSNSNGLKHRSITIREDNPFIYSDADEIKEMIENKETFYVYFGSAYCPWCRSVIEEFINVALDEGIDKVYYVDIWDHGHVEILRDTYELNDKNEVTLKSEGTKTYYDLLKLLDNVLEDYSLTDSEGKTYNVGEKRIFAPDFIYIEKGKAKKATTGIASMQSESRGDLNDEILAEEVKMFKEFFDN